MAGNDGWYASFPERVNPFVDPEDPDPDCQLEALSLSSQEQEFKYDGPKFDFMNCWNCQSFCHSPVYFCSKGHLFCFRCAAYSEFCSSKHPTEKIQLRKLLPYDQEFRLKEPVHCDRLHLGCSRLIHTNNYVDHFQSKCSYRGFIKCFINGCESSPFKIYWGFIDGHMESLHESTKKYINETPSEQSLKIPYKGLTKGIILTPFVFDLGNVRKFIPAIKKDSDRIHFWINMIEDGYVHNYQYSQFYAKIKIHAKDSQSNIYERILEPVRELKKNVVIGPNGIDLDVAEFEKKYLIQTPDIGPYFVVEFGVEERKIVNQAKKPECSSNEYGYGDFPADAEFVEPDYSKIISANDGDSNYEFFEEAKKNVKDILEKREELEKKRIREEYQKYIDGPKPEQVDISYFNKAFPDKTPTEAEEKEKVLVEAHRKAAVEAGKLAPKDFHRLEKNFTWTAADIAILESEGRKGFSRLPTVQSGIYFTDFLKYQMEAYCSAHQEKLLSSTPKRGSFFF